MLDSKVTTVPFLAYSSLDFALEERDSSNEEIQVDSRDIFLGFQED
jgi:hypothetical protein